MKHAKLRQKMTTACRLSNSGDSSLARQPARLHDKRLAGCIKALILKENNLFKNPIQFSGKVWHKLCEYEGVRRKEVAAQTASNPFRDIGAPAQLVHL